MAVIDFLKWDAAPGVLAWKFPSRELSTKSQLIVSESQEACLLREGKYVGPFGAGRHVLNTGNYPGLATIFGLPFGGNSPFTAEVWFVQKAFMLNIRWGTTDSIQIEDPHYHIMLPVRAFGQYGIQIENSGLFLTKLVGTLPAFTVKTLSAYFKGMLISAVKTAIAKCFTDEGISVLHISAHIERLSTSIEETLAQRLRGYGVRICSFCINSISTDERDPAVARLRRVLAERAEMDIMGAYYQQKRSYDVMEKAAANEGAGGMQANMIGVGMGVTMGMGLGQALTPSMGMLGSQIAPATCFCSECKGVNVASSRFCNLCGAPLQFAPQGTAAQAKICSSCGSRNGVDFAFCTHCGSSLTS